MAKMPDFIESIRWTLVAIWIFAALVNGIFLSLEVAKIFNVWERYLGSVIIPVLGMMGTYIIAPYGKYIASVLACAIGFVIVFLSLHPHGIRKIMS